MKKILVFLVISVLLLSSFAVVSSAAESDPVSEEVVTDAAEEAVTEPASGVYYDIYDLFTSYIYGDTELTSDMRLTATIISTLLCVLVFLLPVLVALWFIKYLFAWRY